MKLGQIKDLTRIAYDRTALKYHETFKNEMEQKKYDRIILDKFSDLLGKHSAVCDAGCGPSGHIGKYLVNKGHKAVGIDISEKCIDIAKNYNPEIDFKVLDIMNTDFKDEIFDGIVSFYSIIYTPKKYMHQIFAEFNRILKNGGRILVVVKKGSHEGIIDDDWYEGNKVHFSLFQEEEIKDYLIQGNFRIDFFDTRKPYDFEFNIDRIYAVGTKIKSL